jgi:hypothetical protein
MLFFKAARRREESEIGGEPTWVFEYKALSFAVKTVDREPQCQPNVRQNVTRARDCSVVCGGVWECVWVSLRTNAKNHF